jgi:hypothetical protein
MPEEFGKAAVKAIKLLEKHGVPNDRDVRSQIDLERCLVSEIKIEHLAQQRFRDFLNTHRTNIDPDLLQNAFVNQERKMCSQYGSFLRSGDAASLYLSQRAFEYDTFMAGFRYNPGSVYDPFTWPGS